MSGKKILVQNRRVRHDFFIDEIFEAGIVLTGSEIKSLRQGKASLVDCFADNSGDELFLKNSYIPEYDKANQFSHEPRRHRKLLLHGREIRKIIGRITQKGYTAVPLSIYLNSKNRAKVELALAHGKKDYDKRESIKEREWKKDQARLMREK